ncbi:hypothetical protein FHW88_000471 [Mucilaginibacter sp. SG538B]|nr:hypothetical protein [Mucilaginibacter sp. SG538B]
MPDILLYPNLLKTSISIAGRKFHQNKLTHRKKISKAPLADKVICKINNNQRSYYIKQIEHFDYTT